MPENVAVVINTGPILAIVAALGDLEVLHRHYSQVVVPSEVADELLKSGPTGFGVAEFEAAAFLDKRVQPTVLQPHLAHALDPGEAAEQAALGMTP